ncbi:MAG: J domain-containing protein [Propionibacteriales bacterium]|nr:J domain-containing protein [Propionibacteriales bacterium]
MLDPHSTMSGHGRDLYAVLRLRPDATQDQVSHAFRSLLRRHHPDTRDGEGGTRGGDRAVSDAALQDIIAAYTVLRDPVSRAEYDLRQSAGRSTYGDKAAAHSPPARRDWPSQPVIRAGPVYWRPSQE